MTEIETVPGSIAALNLAWAERFVQSLVLGGVREACVCSGSRSAPLALAFDRSAIRTHIPLDERAGAYFALGLAKASRRPVAIVTTSGTAAANLFPAAIEAHYARIPLLLLTADRPPELRDAGAGQTIDQIKMFGAVARWFHEVGAPASEPDLLEYVASLARRSVAEAWGPPAGPIHLNFAFREPLVPPPDTPIPSSGRPASAREPDTRETYGPEPVPPPSRTVARIAHALRARHRGLIVCGPDDGAPGLADAVARLASVTGYPILADPCSPVRYGDHDRSRVLGAYDGFLRSPRFAAALAPEAILQFGATPTSKAFHQYQALHAGALHLLIDPGRGWRSPARRAREVVPADGALFAEALAERLVPGADPLPGWGEAFRRAEVAARAVIERRVSSSSPLDEGSVVPALLDALPSHGCLYVGNSMAVRDLDLFAPTAPRPLRVLANRGANGIDGVLSSGLGASAATGEPVVIVTGDLSFHHDLNGLAALREGRARAVIVVVNNDGGGIFSFLPIAEHGAAFERYFGTPHGLSFEAAASLYALPYERCGDAASLRAAAARGLQRRESLLIEVPSDRGANRSSHQAVWAEVIQAVEAAR